LHRTIRKVSEDIPRLSYNTAIAALMAYMNVLRAGERRPHRGETEPVVQLIAPFAPHIAEELWERLGHETSVFDGGWPSFDPALAAERTVTVAIQVNGKLRGTVVVAPDAGEDDVYAAAMADPAVARHLTTPPRKRIYVPGRLMNLVAGG
jgi:leucyl-tRNA synthetase